MTKTTLMIGKPRGTDPASPASCPRSKATKAMWTAIFSHSEPRAVEYKTARSPSVTDPDLSLDPLDVIHSRHACDYSCRRLRPLRHPRFWSTRCDGQRLQWVSELGIQMYFFSTDQSLGTLCQPTLHLGLQLFL